MSHIEVPSLRHIRRLDRQISARHKGLTASANLGTPETGAESSTDADT